MSRLSTEAQRRLLDHDAANDRRRRGRPGQARLALAVLGITASLFLWLLYAAVA